MKKQKPIIFGTNDVQAILDGRKTAARFVIKPQPIYKPNSGFSWKGWSYGTDLPPTEKGAAYNFRCAAPYQPGDILYVKEPWHDDRQFTHEDTPGQYFYKSSESEDFRVKWRSPVCMPKEAARIFLKVTDVRVERLRDITEEQAVKEGFFAGRSNIVSGPFEIDDNPSIWTAKEMFEYYWNDAIKPSELPIYGWDANPYVWVVEFEKCENPEFNLNRKMTAQEQRDLIWEKICQKMKSLDLPNMELMTDKKETYWYGEYMFSDDDYLRVEPIHKSGREMVGRVDWSSGPIVSSGFYKSYEEFETILDKFVKTVEEQRKE